MSEELGLIDETTPSRILGRPSAYSRQLLPGRRTDYPADSCSAPSLSSWGWSRTRQRKPRRLGRHERCHHRRCSRPGPPLAHHRMRSVVLMAGETVLTLVASPRTQELRYPSGIRWLLHGRLHAAYLRPSGRRVEGRPCPVHALLDLARRRENVAESLTKGTRVIVQGRLVQRSYTTRARARTARSWRCRSMRSALPALRQGTDHPPARSSGQVASAAARPAPRPSAPASASPSSRPQPSPSGRNLAGALAMAPRTTRMGHGRASSLPRQASVPEWSPHETPSRSRPSGARRRRCPVVL